MGVCVRVCEYVCDSLWRGVCVETVVEHGERGSELRSVRPDER